MEKITMTTPLVEMDGDEMAAILWKETKEKLVLPFVDLNVEYYDLSIRLISSETIILLVPSIPNS